MFYKFLYQVYAEVILHFFIPDHTVYRYRFYFWIHEQMHPNRLSKSDRLFFFTFRRRLVS